jgi:hypothetical protein
MVCMVAIARCFDVAERAQPAENKGDSQTKALNLHPVSERIRIDAQVVSLLCESSAGTLVNPTPAAFPVTPRVPKNHERLDPRLPRRR